MFSKSIKSKKKLLSLIFSGLLLGVTACSSNITTSNNGQYDLSYLEKYEQELGQTKIAADNYSYQRFVLNVNETSFNPAVIPNYVVDLVERLTKAGFETYIVGGCVRDMVWGEPDINDYDVATAATPEQVMEVLPEGKLLDGGFKMVIVSFPEQHDVVEVATFC